MMTDKLTSLKSQLLKEFDSEAALPILFDNLENAIKWYSVKNESNEITDLTMLFYAFEYSDFFITQDSKILSSIYKFITEDEADAIQLNLSSFKKNSAEDIELFDAANSIFLDDQYLAYASYNNASKQFSTFINELNFLTDRAHDKFDKRLKKIRKLLKTEMKSMKENLPSRGIETMFRTTSKNHLELSAIADNKANILLSINVILISIIVSSLATKLDSNPYLITPTIMILTVSMTTIILATISTLPKVTNLGMTRQDIDERKGNLLFFGNFSKMSLSDYEYGMNVLMNDKHYLYGSMVKDIYFLGLVLHRKYKILRYAYLIFMTGLAISLISFIVAASTTIQ